jgi:tRNA (cytidine56-2'-O)-methyltransferase
VRIEVLRLGHRPARDKRITTHVALTARALGAAAIRIAEEDPEVVRSVRSVVERFGGSFAIEAGTGWKTPVREWQKAGGQVVHLTMYGLPLGDTMPLVAADGRDVLLVVGAEKVPADLYALCDHNVAVGSQPHSEVAALALALDRLQGGAWERARFDGGSMRVVPTARGKRVAGSGASEE